MVLQANEGSTPSPNLLEEAPQQNDTKKSAVTFEKDGSICVGQWEPKHSNDKSLNTIFNLYLAPTYVKKKDNKGNLKMKYEEVIEYIPTLKNWNGHDGGNIKSNSDLIQAAKNNPKSLEKWFMPNREMIDGFNARGQLVQKDNIRALIQKMPENPDFLDINKIKKTHTDDRFIFSCTSHPKKISLVFTTSVVPLNDGDSDGSWDEKELVRLPILLVRAELQSRNP